MQMESISNSMFSYVLISFLMIRSCNGTDRISQNQTMADGETLVSSGGTFVLGFFKPPGSTNRYLGVWYKRSPETIVWVANKVSPLTDSDGVLTIHSDGNLVLLNGTKRIIWSSNSSSADAQMNLVAELLDSGNLVLKRQDDLKAESYVWQSFDFLTDTLLPGMRKGINLRTGKTWYLTSWRNQSDASPGEFTYKLDNVGLPQFVLRKGSEKKFRTGPWNGERFSGSDVRSSSFIAPIFVYNDTEIYYTYEMTDSSVLSRVTLNESGMIQAYMMNKGSSDWILMYKLPYDMCEEYGKCGPNGICRINSNPICQCLDGFVPKSKGDWDVLIWSGGCKRRTPLDCKSGEGFLKLKNVKLPDLLDFRLSQSMTTRECERECLKDCSCFAFTDSNITSGGSGCLMWFGDLIDIQEYDDKYSEQDIYLRMPKSELDAIENQNKKRALLILVVPTVFGGILVLCFVICCTIRRRKKKRGMKKSNDDIELPLYQLEAVTLATKSFSFSNIIGEGGFGPVYKGRLETGVEIAVKRLSQTSRQGLGEFKNEVILISKLQHRNLVRLLGCCLDGNERMLIYEYMTNGSLDYFIFDQSRKKLLTWKKRFEIALGISRGLLYLHQDSRLRIIHRDLKASNVLLDDELNPKISDFGIAKSFRGDQTEGKTRTVIGTFGYMSPEYAFSGTYSVKSDVFSLGVLLLELVSGRRNRTLDHSDQHQSLLGHAWLLWTEDKALQLMDECLKESSVESQVLRCIQVALLCVQKHPEDRPTMAAVVIMLSNETVSLPQPKHPGFFLEGNYAGVSETSTEERLRTLNAVTITQLEGR
ncbi:G-type lectin S-receptor-like serine/threonine-protein kinase At4g27290 [Coffea arabica]|uniref:Receptor-like serine/threonine-protein kinase n=1 Tax=Coffea arabica TaxID=13443 RepID=A0A6P6WFZ8_COFAR